MRQREVERYRAQAADFRRRARSAQYLGWHAEMFDYLRAAAFCTVQALRLLP